MMFKEGDFIRGKKQRNSIICDENMIKAEVILTQGSFMNIKILEHKNKKFIGMKPIVDNKDSKFELINTYKEELEDENEELYERIVELEKEIEIYEEDYLETINEMRELERKHDQLKKHFDNNTKRLDVLLDCVDIVKLLDYAAKIND